MAVSYLPSIEEVRGLSGRGNLVPVYREIAADLETPVSAYLKIARGPYSFLLESVEGGERLGRYSFIGTEPNRVMKTGIAGEADSYRDPLKDLELELGKVEFVSVPGLPGFQGGAVGYLGYECAAYFEKLPSPDRDEIGVPESLFMLTDTLLVFDHLRHRIAVVAHARLDGGINEAYRAACARIDELVRRLQGPVPPQPPRKAPPPDAGEVRSNFSEAAYCAVVERCKEYIRAGDIIQVVPSQRLSRRTTAAPFDIYRALRAANPSPYMYYLQLDDMQVVGTSPELLVKVEQGKVAVHPIAGTRPRGSDDSEDQALEKELLADEKERAEHIMLVDLGRNDVGRVSSPGTVNVEDLMSIERYSKVMHIVSHVTGELAPDTMPFDALRSCFPAGTLSGAPKIRAMEIIAEIEPTKRAVYGGTVGYVSFSGDLDTAIAIRTLLLKDGVAYVQAGGGVVADSVPLSEYKECLQKASAVLNAIDEAEAGFDGEAAPEVSYDGTPKTY